MIKEKDIVNKDKARFYFQEKLICHIRKRGEGFVNGWFRSDLINDLYFLFEDQRWEGREIKLFLSEIFDISDYEVRG